MEQFAARCHSEAATAGREPALSEGEGNLTTADAVDGEDGNAGAFTTVYKFCLVNPCTDGSFPHSTLLQATDGNIYGSAGESGTKNNGTVFQLDIGAAPFVRTLTPSGGIGAKIVILGMNLTGTTAVTFNGTPATFTVVAPGEITAKVPAGATTGTIQVTTPGGILLSNAPFKIS
jgi:hypothetical protein